MTEAPPEHASLIDWQILIGDLNFLVQHSFSEDPLPPLKKCISSGHAFDLDEQHLDLVKNTEERIRKNESLDSLEARAYAMGYSHALSVNLLPRNFYTSLFSLGQRKRKELASIALEDPVAAGVGQSTVVVPITHLTFLNGMEWRLSKLDAIRQLDVVIPVDIDEKDDGELMFFHGFTIGEVINIPLQQEPNSKLHDPRFSI